MLHPHQPFHCCWESPNTSRGRVVKFHMKGAVNSDHLNHAGYVVLGAAVQSASSFYRPLSTVAREWASNSVYFYPESLEIRRSWCCENNLHSMWK